MTQGLRCSVTAVLGVVMALLPATVSAQRASEDRVAAAIGKDVTVTLQDGTKHRGKLRTLSAAEVVLEQSIDLRDSQSSSTREFKHPLDGVRHIQRNSHAILKGVIIGLAAGFFAGLATFASEGTADADDAPYILSFSGIGAAAGVGIGAALRPSAASRMVYQTPTKTTISLAPTLGKGKFGVAGTIRW